VLESAFALFHQDETDAEGNVITYTAKQRLDWIVRVLIPQMLVDKARQYNEQTVMRETQETLVKNALKFE
jgi:DNA-binding transcriptional regulator/RsmH inhibitor MraZ